MIYFLLNETDNTCKIGTSGSPKDRLKAIQKTVPVPLKGIGVMVGGRVREQKLHAQFADLRVTGEWFRYEEPLVGYIKHYAVPFDPKERAAKLKAMHGDHPIFRHLELTRWLLPEDTRVQLAEMGEWTGSDPRALVVHIVNAYYEALKKLQDQPPSA